MFAQLEELETNPSNVSIWLRAISARPSTGVQRTQIAHAGVVLLMLTGFPR